MIINCPHLPKYALIGIWSLGQFQNVEKSKNKIEELEVEGSAQDYSPEVNTRVKMISIENN